MTGKLTTAQIIQHIESAVAYPEYEWEYAIENAVDTGLGEAVDGARFLEQMEPGRTWSADEYHGLMHNHFTGRWSSAAEIGYIRANEMFTDAIEEAGDDEKKRDWARRVFAERTASDEDAEKFIRSMIGTFLFDSADGTVLTFDRIFNGTVEKEFI